MRPAEYVPTLPNDSQAWSLLLLASSLLRPPPGRTPDQWADANRVLPPGSAEPGPWRSSRAPYTIGPARASVDPRFAHVYVCMMAQGGKTAGTLNVIGQRLDDDPAPVLYIGPTRNNVISVIWPKIDEMLRHCPSLWLKTAQGKRYTKSRMVVSGVSLRLAWAGSPTEMAADAACVVIVDELDRMPRDIKGEGNVIGLADARHSSYPDGRTIVISTPTDGNVDTEVDARTGLEHWRVSEPEQVPSPIWLVWQEGTRHEWAWPCPECREYFVPRFHLLVWPEGATPSQARKDATLACPHCGVMVHSKHRDWMNARGVYVAPGQRPLANDDQDEGASIADYTGDAPPDLRRGGTGVQLVEYGDFCLPEKAASDDASFWVSGLANFSAKKTFGALAATWLRAVQTGEPEKIKGCLNTQFGELFRFGGEAPAWEAVAARKRDYSRGEIPPGVNVLTSGVDVQKDRLVYVVRGWGRDFESWLIDEGELWGATDKPEVWSQLSALLDRQWGAFGIARMLVDSGYRADEVYAFCRVHAPRALACKGHDSLARPFYASLIDVSVDGKRVKNGLQLWHWDTDVAKSWVHGRIEWPDDQPGAWHLPGDVSEAYCRQIVAEERVRKASGRVTWIRRGENHDLDCEAMARVAAQIVRNVHLRIAGVADKGGPRGGRRVLSRGVEV